MAKFFRLVQNEYIKTVKKVSTIIMLIIVILAGIVLPLLGEIFYKIEGSADDINDRFFNSCLENIEYAKTAKPDDWEYDVQMYQLLYDNKISIVSDWRYLAVVDYYDEIKQTDKDEQIKALLKEANEKIYNALKSNDYTAYANGKIEYNEKALKMQGADEKAIEVANWEYHYRIDNKTEPPKVFTEGDDNITKLAEIKTQLYELEITPNPNQVEMKNLTDKATVYEYMLKNKIDINTAWSTAWYSISTDGEYESVMNFWRCLVSNTSVISIVGILMIIVAGGIIANEFSNGTIKFLLINPAKRWKVLMAKYFTTITIGYIMILILFAVSYMMSGIIYGFGGQTAEYIVCKDGSVSAYNATLMMLRDYLVSGVLMVVTSTLAFAISSMIRSTALAVGVSLFVYFAGSFINGVISMLGLSWGKYLIFANMDLLNVANGKSAYFEHSLGFAVVVVAVHLFTFILMAWDGFTKKEI